MSDVFIAYKRADRARIEPLLTLLRADGFDPWLDDFLDPARDWRPQVEARIDHARVVLACWTHAACASPFVIEEARRAARRGILFSAQLDPGVIAPVSAHAHADLSAWTGCRDHPAARALRAHLAARLSSDARLLEAR